MQSPRQKPEFNASVGDQEKQKETLTELQNGRRDLMKSYDENNLGVMMQDKLSLERHTNGIFGSTYNLLSK